VFSLSSFFFHGRQSTLKNPPPLRQEMGPRTNVANKLASPSSCPGSFSSSSIFSDYVCAKLKTQLLGASICLWVISIAGHCERWSNPATDRPSFSHPRLALAGSGSRGSSDRGSESSLEWCPVTAWLA
jgi:hypothetical protein